MGRLNGRVFRAEDDERERAIREVRRILSEIPDDELLELHTFEKGAAPRPADLGLSWPLVLAAIGNPDATVSDVEKSRRLEQVLRPCWDRLTNIRKRRKA